MSNNEVIASYVEAIEEYVDVFRAADEDCASAVNEVFMVMADARNSGIKKWQKPIMGAMAPFAERCGWKLSKSGIPSGESAQLIGMISELFAENPGIKSPTIMSKFKELGQSIKTIAKPRGGTLAQEWPGIKADIGSVSDWDALVKRVEELKAAAPPPQKKTATQLSRVKAALSALKAAEKAAKSEGVDEAAKALIPDVVAQAAAYLDAE